MFTRIVEFCAMCICSIGINQKELPKKRNCAKPVVGIEPTTYTLPRCRNTSMPHRRFFLFVVWVFLFVYFGYILRNYQIRSYITK